MVLAEQVEDFWFLLHNLAHWEFELFLMFIFDVVLGLLLIPFVKRWLKKHDERKHAHEHCEDVHGEQGELF
jgi:membrane protein implicated in regulation of membrane protease activity